MNNADNLPEEKLLRLIKGGKKAAGDGTVPVEDIVINRRTRALRVRFSRSHLKACAAGLLAFSAVLLIYTVLAPAGPAGGSQPKTVRRQDAAPEAPRTLEQYLEGMDAGKIFTAQVAAGEAGREKEAVLPELVKDLNLLGIVSGDAPQAVIEDKKNQQTYYLTKGQFIDEMQVCDIQENKVILEYKGKHAELHL